MDEVDARIEAHFRERYARRTGTELNEDAEPELLAYFRWDVVSFIAEHHIRILGPSQRGWADYEKRGVKIPAIKDEFTYLLSLHEIGHIVSMDECLERRGGEYYEKVSAVDREAIAWTWALDQSLIPVDLLDRKTRREILRRFFTYVSGELMDEESERTPPKILDSWYCKMFLRLLTGK